MRTIISALHFEWSEMDDCFDTVKNDLKLDGVELSFHDSMNRPHCVAEDFKTMRAESEKHEIELHAHIWENIARLGVDRGAEALLRWLTVCEKNRVESLVVHGGSHPNRELGIEITRRTFESVLPRFERANVVLNLENHDAYEWRGCQELFSEVWEFQKILSIDSPSLRFCFDTGHALLTGNSTDLLENLAPYLSHIHLADNFGLEDDHCGYKKGKVDWNAFFDTLSKINFDGAFCVEFPVRDDKAPFKASMKDLNKYLNRYSGNI